MKQRVLVGRGPVLISQSKAERIGNAGRMAEVPPSLH